MSKSFYSTNSTDSVKSWKEQKELLKADWFKQMRLEAVTSRVLCFKTGKLLLETDEAGKVLYVCEDCGRLK